MSVIPIYAPATLAIRGLGAPLCALTATTALKILRVGISTTSTPSAGTKHSRTALRPFLPRRALHTSPLRQDDRSPYHMRMAHDRYAYVNDAFKNSRFNDSIPVDSRLYTGSPLQHELSQQDPWRAPSPSYDPAIRQEETQQYPMHHPAAQPSPYPPKSKGQSCGTTAPYDPVSTWEATQQCTTHHPAQHEPHPHRPARQPSKTTTFEDKDSEKDIFDEEITGRSIVIGLAWLWAAVMIMVPVIYISGRVMSGLLALFDGATDTPNAQLLLSVWDVGREHVLGIPRPKRSGRPKRHIDENECEFHRRQIEYWKAEAMAWKACCEDEEEKEEDLEEPWSFYIYLF